MTAPTLCRMARKEFSLAKCPLPRPLSPSIAPSKSPIVSSKVWRRMSGTFAEKQPTTAGRRTAKSPPARNSRITCPEKSARAFPESLCARRKVLSANARSTASPAKLARPGRRTRVTNVLALIRPEFVRTSAKKTSACRLSFQ